MDTPIRVSDRTLVQLLDKPHHWFHRFAQTGEDTIRTLAHEEGESGPYLTRVMYLVFLASDIAQAIRTGANPLSLTADRMVRQVPLPMRWEAQRRLLGFASDKV